MKRLSQARHYLVNQMDLEKIDSDDLNKMSEICQDILRSIKFTGKKSVNH